MEDKISFLSERASLEGTEIGDAVLNLLCLQGGEPYLSEEFWKVYEKEIDRWYNWFKKYTRIEEKEETCTFKTKELVIYDRRSYGES